jgi:cation diffusion facilitator CzcD-associated flavoprotein CzcO
VDNRAAAEGGRHVRIAIIGTGFAGVGAAIRLRQTGYSDFVVFERAEDVGGVWRDNTYPGCACDVESHLYAFSFVPNPGWSRTHARQPEILAYLRDCAARFGVLPHVAFGHDVEDARYDESSHRWRLRTNRGIWTADIVVVGTGVLNEPAMPDLPGLETFSGVVFHSSRWDHRTELSGKHVVVIGNGASAVQFVPEIAPLVAALTIIQRSAAWVLPHRDRAITDRHMQVCARLPWVASVWRQWLYLRRELLVPVIRHALGGWALERVALRYLAQVVRDPDLRTRLTPTFRMGCKRILVSSRYLQTLPQRHVRVVTGPVREVRGQRVVTTDGVEHAADVLILATGFATTDLPIARRIHGRIGRTLRETWAGRPQAFQGTTVHGFPNLFLLLGPNTYLAHSSVLLMLERQIDLLLAALRYFEQHSVTAMEPRAETQADYVRRVDAASARTAWTAGGCMSWYLDDTGRNAVLWPGAVRGFRRATRFRPADYAFTRDSGTGAEPR